MPTIHLIIEGKADCIGQFVFYGNIAVASDQFDPVQVIKAFLLIQYIIQINMEIHFKWYNRTILYGQSNKSVSER